MDTRDIFAKAVRRAKVNGVSEFDRYGVIVSINLFKNDESEV